MELTLNKRPSTKKGETKKLRLMGEIPAVLYSAGSSTEKIFVSRQEWEAIMRKIKPGRLPTTVFTLKEGKKSHQAVVKEVQYHPTSYQVLHVDFEQLNEKHPINVKVPIECINVQECAGVKQGGIFRQVIRSIKVRCLPKNIPSEFTIDVAPLNLLEEVRLADLKIPETLKPLVRMEEVAVVIGKR